MDDNRRRTSGLSEINSRGHHQETVPPVPERRLPYTGRGSQVSARCFQAAIQPIGPGRVGNFARGDLDNRLSGVTPSDLKLSVRYAKALGALFSRREDFRSRNLGRWTDLDQIIRYSVVGALWGGIVAALNPKIQPMAMRRGSDSRPAAAIERARPSQRAASTTAPGQWDAFATEISARIRASVTCGINGRSSVCSKVSRSAARNAEISSVGALGPEQPRPGRLRTVTDMLKKQRKSTKPGDDPAKLGDHIGD